MGRENLQTTHVRVSAVLRAQRVSRVVARFHVHLDEVAQVHVLLRVAVGSVTRPYGHVDVESLICLVLAVLDAKLLAFAKLTLAVAIDTETRALLEEKCRNATFKLVASVRWVACPVSRRRKGSTHI